MSGKGLFIFASHEQEDKRNSLIKVKLFLLQRGGAAA